MATKRDHQTNKQDQTEAFSNEDTLVGATLACNKKKIRQIVDGDYSRLLTTRGAVGETCIHMCFLFPSPEKLDMARWLLSLCPDLITSGG